MGLSPGTKKIHRQKYKKGIFQPVENFFEIRVVELDLLPHVTSFISRSTDYTANVHRQTTDKLMFKSVISTVR